MKSIAYGDGFHEDNKAPVCAGRSAGCKNQGYVSPRYNTGIFCCAPGAARDSHSVP